MTLKYYPGLTSFPVALDSGYARKVKPGATRTIGTRVTSACRPIRFFVSSASARFSIKLLAFGRTSMLDTSALPTSAILAGLPAVMLRPVDLRAGDTIRARVRNCGRKPARFIGVVMCELATPPRRKRRVRAKRSR